MCDPTSHLTSLGLYPSIPINFMVFTVDDAAQYTLLIACGDQAFGHALVDDFAAEGIGARLVTHGARVMDLVRASAVDLVIVSDTIADVEMLELCHILKDQAGIPVVVVSSRRAGVDPVSALDLGADDVVNGIRPRELVARVRAVARRYDRRPTACRRVLAAGGVELDLDERTAAVGGTSVHLTLKEFGVLSELVANPGRVMTRRQLIQKVWGPGFGGDGKTLDVHIRRLRAKVEDDPSRPHRILTVRGVGFRYAASERLAAAV
jgi:two-component system, OmpR family, response regulator RegX3